MRGRRVVKSARMLSGILGLVTLGACALETEASLEPQTEVERATAAIVNGNPTDSLIDDWFGLVMLIHPIVGIPDCSGVAVGPQMFLSAAHCPHPEEILFHGQIYTVDKVVVAPGWSPGAHGGSDLMVGFLDEPLVGMNGGTWSNVFPWTDREGPDMVGKEMYCFGKGSGSYRWARLTGVHYTSDSHANNQSAGTFLAHAGNIAFQGGDSGGPCFSINPIALAGVIKGEGPHPSVPFVSFPKVVPFDQALRVWTGERFFLWVTGNL